MEINSWMLYWFTRLDSIGNFFNFLSFIMGIVTVVIAVMWLLSMEACLLDSDFWENFRKNRIKLLLISFIISCFIYIPCIFIPTTKEMAFIYLTPKVINNKEIQKLPINAVKLLNTKMEQYINDIAK